MKKFILLLITLVSLLGLNAQTFVSGTLNPVPSNPTAFQVTLLYTDASTTLTSVVTLDTLGSFSTAFGNGSQGTVTASFTNCNGSNVSFGATSNPVGVYDFGTLDYCPNPNTNLTAIGSILNAPSNFSVNLSYDEGLTFTTVAVDSSGNFSDVVTVPSGINYVIMSFVDCNNVLYTDSASIAPALVGYMASFANANYCNSSTMSTTVSGSFLNLNGFLNYSISLDNGLTYQSFSVTPNGAFNEVFNNLFSASGMALIQYVDCNGNLIVDTAYNISASPNQEIFDFGNIDFCPSTASGTYFQVSGQFIPNAGIVNYTLQYNNTIISGVTDSTGLIFIDSIATSTMPSVVYISFVDCNGNPAMDTAYPSVTLPFPAPFDFGNIDYCPTVTPVVCAAGFFANQNIIVDSFGNIVVAQVIMIQNTSQGQNLSYAWDFGDGSPIYNGQNFLHTYANAGPYVLCLTVTSPATPTTAACTSTFCDSLMVDTNGILMGKNNSGFTIQMGDGSDNTTGINQLEENITNLNIYPNPASETFNISINAKKQKSATLNIYDLRGTLIQENPLNIETGESQIKINIEDLNKGIYLVQIKTDNGFITKKLFVK